MAITRTDLLVVGGALAAAVAAYGWGDTFTYGAYALAGLALYGAAIAIVGVTIGAALAVARALWETWTGKEWR